MFKTADLSKIASEFEVRTYFVSHVAIDWSRFRRQ